MPARRSRPTSCLPQHTEGAWKAGEHPALAHVIQLSEWDCQLAENEYRSTLELNTNEAMSHSWYAEYLQVLGRNEEALREQASE